MPTYEEQPELSYRERDLIDSFRLLPLNNQKLIVSLSKRLVEVEKNEHAKQENK